MKIFYISLLFLFCFRLSFADDERLFASKSPLAGMIYPDSIVDQYSKLLVPFSSSKPLLSILVIPSFGNQFCINYYRQEDLGDYFLEVRDLEVDINDPLLSADSVKVYRQVLNEEEFAEVIDTFKSLIENASNEILNSTFLDGVNYYFIYWELGKYPATAWTNSSRISESSRLFNLLHGVLAAAETVRATEKVALGE
jgi:hypothetical protein